jgi:PKD repeat protein
MYCISSYAQISNPKQLNGLKLWLAADSGVVISTGTSVSQWTDLSGNNNNAIQVTQGNQPTIITGTINGLPVISFNGSNNFMLTPTGLLDNFSAISIFAVIKLKVNQNAGIFGSNLGYVNLELTSQNNGRIRIRNNNNAIAFVDSSLLPINKWQIMSVIANNGSGRGWKNEIEATTNITAAQLPIATGIQQALGRYASSFGNYYAQFDIAEFIIYDSALTSTQRVSIENYLHNKYAPPVNLGADINVSNNFCNITLDAKVGYTNYLWSTGASTQTVSVNKAGDYWVKTTDVFGFSSSDTIHVSYPDGSYKGNTFLCLGGTKVWNTFLPKNNYTFKWQDNSTDSLFAITTPGSYSVTVTDKLACSTSYSLAVSVDNFPITASLGNDTSICSGNLIYLKKGAATTASYLWSNGTTNDSLPIFSSGKYSVIATDIYGCVKKDTIHVLIAGVAPTANFSFDTVCFGKPTHFIDLSSPLPSVDSIVSRFWSFGDLNTLDTSATTFTHTFADTGAFMVKLTVTTDSGCSAEQTKLLYVFPYPVVNFTSTNLCANGITQFAGTATTFNYPITNWIWNFGDAGSGINNTSTSQNTTHSFGGYGSYTVQLIGKSVTGCADTTTNSLSVSASPASNFGYSLPCVNNVIQFTDLTPITPLFFIQNYYWNFGDLVTSALPNPIHAFSNNQTYTIKYVVIASNGCADSMIVPLAIHPTPVSGYTYSNACANSLTNYTDTSKIATGNISKRNWSFGDNTFSSVQNPSHTYTDSISARVKLVTTSDFGCKDSLTKTVYIRTSPIASFSMSPSYGSPPLIANFINGSSGATNYLWKIADTTFTSSNPQYTFTKIGNYPIQLKASTNFGCVSTQTNTITVSPEHVDVAIQNLSTFIQNNYLTISAQFLNYSSMDVTSMDILIEVSGVAAIKEKWTGLLVKNGLLLDTISGSIYATGDNHFVCVTLENPNGLQDEVPENNNTCRAMNESAFQILSLYPNPTHNTLTIPMVIPQSNTLNITLYNILGQQVQQVYATSINKGLQLITVDTGNLASGVYSLRFEYAGQVIVKKFMKD